MTRYIATTYGSYKIEPIEIERETEKTYWIKDHASGYRKIQSYEKMFDTFEKARQFLFTECERKVTYLKKQTNDENSKLGMIFKMAKE